MSFSVESKSQLAKLMATENLTIEHQKINTAMFDVKNRILYLPIWKDMSGFMYDHLAGHEVGHALYTPPEGAHNAIIDNSKKKGWKSFLNVIEDVRIEKKIQRRYPGLRGSFIKGYKSLFARDFFGIGGRSINNLSFINRLNIFTKSQYTEEIRFSNEELAIIERIKNLETFEQVLALTDELYERAKDEEKEEELPNFDQTDNGESDYDDYMEPDSNESESDESEESNDSEESEESEESNDSEESDDSGDSEESEESDDDGIENEKDSTPADSDPTCDTDENYRRNESLLLDACCREYVYVTLPKPNLDNIVTKAARVQELLTQDFESQIQQRHMVLTSEKIATIIKDFKNRNERYVGLLAKEFEMRKAAKTFSKAKLADTGDIDVNKLASYKFDDNIFRKVMTMPKGKSHGLVLLLDYSGSMGNNMAGSIEQILVLSMFCRKVNIPFVVYSFSNSYHTKKIDFRGQDIARASEMFSASFSKNVKEIELSGVSLREYLNSDMSNAEFNRAMRNMIFLREAYNRYGFFRIPESEHLSNTPLNEALVALAPIVRNFKSSKKLDLTNVIIVHDGDADGTRHYWTHSDNGMMMSHYMDINKTNVVLCDPKFKYQKQIVVDNYVWPREANFTNVLLDWFSHVTGSKVLGFFIVPPSGRWLKRAIDSRYTDANKKSMNQLYREDRIAFETKKSSLARKIREDGFLESHLAGYDIFYMILGGKELLTEDDEIQIEGKVTASKLKNAFMKMNKKRSVSRILVNKFIQKIAAA